ncbi:carbonic anhydrase 12-like [Saccoglossus kowalevskii]
MSYDNNKTRIRYLPFIPEWSYSGETVQVNFTGDYLISGGGLTNTYKATMLHFHWDGNGVHGSEHTLDEVRYPIEMHLIGYDFEKYDDFDSALSHPEGIIVVATFLEITSEDNPNYSEMFTGFNSVTYKGQSYQYPSPFPILPMLPYNTWDFYRYHGSLTTPACDEGVLWTVFVQYQQISHDQVRYFIEKKKFVPGYVIDDWSRDQPLV